MADDIYKINLRLPPALGEQIKAQAALAHRSINAQIEYILTTFLADDASQRVESMEAALARIEGDVEQLKQSLTRYKKVPADPTRRSLLESYRVDMEERRTFQEAAIMRGDDMNGDL